MRIHLHLRAGRCTGLLLAALVFATLVFVAAGAWAHGGQPTLLKLDLRGDSARLELVFTAIDLEQRFPAFRDPRLSRDPAARAKMRADVTAYLDERVQLVRGGRTCAGSWNFAPAGSNLVAATSERRCLGVGRYTLTAEPFFDLGPGHQVIVRVDGGGDRIQTAVLRPGAARLDLVAPRGWAGMLADFIADGFVHILSGIDHVLFVAGLLLVAAGSRRRILVAMTGFTLAHTLTLLAASFDWIRVSTVWVEAVIAASIAYLGLEALSDQGHRRSVYGVLALHGLALVAALLGRMTFPSAAMFGLLLFAVAWTTWLRSVPGAQRGVADAVFPFAFGLAHGLGFASPMQTLALSRGDLIVGVLGFNLGVEVGQGAVVVAILAVAAALRRLAPQTAWPALAQRLEVAAAYGLVGIGLVWFALRAF